MARVVRVRLAADQLIAGKLLTEKLVDRLVLIEGLKNIVAVVPGIGATGVFSTAAVALRITGYICLLYTSPSPRDQRGSRMPSSA